MKIRVKPATRQSGFAVSYTDHWGASQLEIFPDEMTARAYTQTLEMQQAIFALQKQSQQSRMLVREAINIFLYKRPIAQTTRDFHAMKLHKFCAAFPSTPIAALTPGEIESYLATRMNKVAATTYRVEVAILRTLFRWLKDRYIIPINPAASLRMPRRVRSSGRALSYIEEFRLLMKATPFTRPRIILATDTGMRSEDIAALRRQNLNLKDRTISFFIRKNRHEISLPMTNRLHQELTVFAKLHLENLLFPGWHGQPMDTLGAFLKHINKCLGTHHHMHLFRHTFCTRLTEASGDERLALWCLGNEVQDMGNVYYHPSMERLRREFEKMEEITVSGLAQCQIETLDVGETP